LLAAANLILLGMRLWPWQEVLNLPANGTPAIDPAVCLVGYMALFFFIANTRNESTRKALSTAAVFGLLAGAILVLQILLKTQFVADTFHPRMLRVGLLLAAGVVWGIAGLRGSKQGGSAGIGMLSGLWCAMVSALMASSTILLQLYLATSLVPESSDPWKQYEGLAIGNAATQALVTSLNSATWFLLMGPIAGTALALLFSVFGQGKED